VRVDRSGTGEKPVEPSRTSNAGSNRSVNTPTSVHSRLTAIVCEEHLLVVFVGVVTVVR